MTAPTRRRPRVTDCRARILAGAVILCGCPDCGHVDPADVRFAEDVAAALRMCTTGRRGGAT